MNDIFDPGWEIRFRYEWNMARKKILGKERWERQQERELKQQDMAEKASEAAYFGKKILQNH